MTLLKTTNFTSELILEINFIDESNLYELVNPVLKEIVKSIQFCSTS